MLEKDHSNRMISEGINKQRILRKNEARMESVPGSDTEEITVVQTYM